MKKSLAVTLVALFVLAVSFAMVPKKANAIPAFAQKYHFSCAVCHTVFPNLNPFGRAFWRNGFRLPGTNGTPADATQITNGLSLPNPWPIPLMISSNIWYKHTTNENVSNSTDPFNAKVNFVVGGADPIYTPLANSLSFYVHMHAMAGGKFGEDQVWASLNGVGSAFGLPAHLLNLKLGQITTASPYFYRQNVIFPTNGPVGSLQSLSVGYDGEAGTLIHSQNAGFELYGTPGYHLWYKVTVTNDAGSGNGVGGTCPAGDTCTAQGATANQNSGSNAMEYSYQLKEYAPTPMGQFEIGYYGATIAEPISKSATNSVPVTSSQSWNNRVIVNGVDVDLANDIYELGLTYMVQSDSNPYGPSGSTLPTNITDTSNGYSTFEAYGRYLMPNVGNGLMLVGDYATYSYTHKNSQEAFNGTYGASCSNENLYGGASSWPTCVDGIKDDLTLEAEYNLSYNAHLYAGYDFTNVSEFDQFQTGIFFAF